MRYKTLAEIALSLVLGLGSVGCSKTNKPQQTQLQNQLQNISGEIVDIDEDSFAILTGRKGANFEFEHFRIKTPDGKIYKLIFPGPSNYQIGDLVNFQYKPQSRISHKDLGRRSWSRTIHPWQNGFFEADGLIQR